MIPLLRAADRWIERAVLRELAPWERRLLDGTLAAGCATAAALALLVPGSAALVLLLAAMIVCFFKGWRASVILVPVLAFHHAIRGGAAEGLLLAGAGALGILFSVVTTQKYREARGHARSMQAGLQTARRVQQALRPPELARNGPLLVAARVVPCEEVGGDFLLLQPLDGNRYGVLLGDVMGKGVPAALVSAYLDGLYQELARQGTKPAQTMEVINRRLIATFGFGRLFATLVVVEADLEHGVWRFCRAGHEPPLLRRSDGTFEELAVGGLPVGVAEEHYREGSTALAAGDQILMATDGLLGDSPSPAHLRQLLDEVAPLPPGRALDRLVEDLSARWERFGMDDATAALVRLEEP